MVLLGETKMNFGKYLLTGVLGLVAGMLVGTCSERYEAKPVAIYERRIEGDQRNFLVVERRGPLEPKKIPFVKQADGSFKRLDDVQTVEGEELYKKLRE